MDAYTLRKIAPRILIGVIGINLSIYLCVAAIDITEVIGRGIGDLLRAPFIGANSFTGGSNGIGIEANTENTVVGIVGVGAIGALVGTIFATHGAAAVAILGLLLPLIVTVSLVAVAVLITVVIRYGLLIFLSVISPVAIACFILPGTEKYFRQWWDLFIKALLVYPLIAVFFALSDILAAIFLKQAGAETTDDGIGLVFLFVTVVAIIAPLVLIPFAFKFAGGVLAQAMNVAEGRARGISNMAGERIRKTREDPNSWLGRNTASTRMWRREKGLYAGDVASGITRGLGERVRGRSFRKGWQDVRRSTREARGAAMAAALAQNSEYAKATAQIDEAQMDMAKYGSSAASRAAIANGTHISMGGALNKAAQEIYGAKFDELDATQKQQVMKSDTVKKRQEQLRMYSAMNDKIGRSPATRAAAAKSAAALSYGYDQGEEGWNQAVSIANDIYNNDETQVLSHMNELQYVAGQVGRSDLSGNVNSLEYNPIRAGGKVAGAQVMSSGKPAAVEGIIKEQLGVIEGDGDYKTKLQAVQKLADLRAGGASPYATGANKDKLAEYEQRIRSVIASDKFAADKTMHAQAAAAAQAEDSAGYAENIFTNTTKVAGTRTVKQPDGTEITVPNEVPITDSNQPEVIKAASALSWFDKQSGRQLSEAEIAEQAQASEQQAAEQSQQE